MRTAKMQPEALNTLTFWDHVVRNYNQDEPLIGYFRELKAKIDCLETSNDFRSKNVKRLRRENKKHVELIGQLASENGELREKVKLLETQMNEITNENRRLGEKLQHVENELSQLAYENRHLRENVQLIEYESYESKDDDGAQLKTHSYAKIEHDSFTNDSNQLLEVSLRVETERKQSNENSQLREYKKLTLVEPNASANGHIERLHDEPMCKKLKLLDEPVNMSITKIGPIKIIEFDGQTTRYEMLDGSLMIGDGVCYTLAQVATYRNGGKMAASRLRLGESKVLFHLKPVDFMLQSWRENLTDIDKVTMSLGEYDLQSEHVGIDKIINAYNEAVDIVVEKGGKFLRVIPPPTPPQLWSKLKMKYNVYAAYIRESVFKEKRLKIFVSSRMDGFLRTYDGEAFYLDILTGRYQLHYRAIHAFFKEYI